MKIGIDCRLWNETGIGRYIRNLIKNLQTIDRSNRYVLFVLNKNREEILKQVQNDNFRIVEANIRWHTIEEQLKFPKILNRENLDLMHFPYVAVPIFYKRSFVVTVHDLIPFHFPTGKASTLPLPLYKLKLLGYRFVVSAAAKKAKKIIVVSNATKHDIVDCLKVSEEKVRVIYEGVGDKITNPKSQIPNKYQNTKYKILDSQYFLYVGNAFPHKNLDRLLEAFVLFYHSDSSTKLVLVGKEDYFYKKLKEKVRHMKLEKSVIFLGEVSDEELGSLYKNAKALVLPSLMEGFGLPALEAMANECLVLASKISALEEICADSAIYFDPYDVKDIVQKMRNVYSNDIYHLSKKKEKALLRAKKFSWEKMAKETLRIYESCVSL